MSNALVQTRGVNGTIDLASLSAFHRILLTTDGTLTEMLEVYFLERIQLVKLSEDLVLSPKNIPALNVKQGDEILDRKILLRGSASERNFVYAESVVAVGRLDLELQEKLKSTKTPMGRLWLEHKMETFKEMIDIGRESANELAFYFDIEPEDDLLFRTYRVFSKSKPVFLITEKFPVKNLH